MHKYAFLLVIVKIKAVGKNKIARPAGLHLYENMNI